MSIESPAAETWLLPASRPASDTASQAGRAAAKAKTGGLRILIVEDEAVIALELEAMIEELGHSVAAIAASESEAIRLSQAKHPNLILMDVRLGRGGDGIKAAQAILKHMKVPIVFCSAYARDPGTRERMQEVQPSGILSKPLVQVDLKETLERLAPPS